MVELLPVKFYKQTEPMYCYISCTKMIVDYAIDELNVSQSRLSIHDIAEETRTHPQIGTAWSDIERINDLLKDSFPPISFEVQVGGSLEDIVTELYGENSRPLIAWIIGVIDDGDTIFHSVVINGVSEDSTRIFYIDPAMTVENHQCEVEIGDFLDKKLGVDGRLVKLVIKNIGQKDLMGKMGPIIRRRRK